MKLRPLNSWDFPDTELVPDGWYMTTVPSLTRDNFNVLVEQHNELVEIINTLFEDNLTLQLRYLERSKT